MLSALANCFLCFAPDRSAQDLVRSTLAQHPSWCLVFPYCTKRLPDKFVGGGEVLTGGHTRTTWRYVTFWFCRQSGISWAIICCFVSSIVKDQVRWNAPHSSSFCLSCGRIPWQPWLLWCSSNQHCCWAWNSHTLGLQIFDLCSFCSPWCNRTEACPSLQNKHPEVQAQTDVNNDTAFESDVEIRHSQFSAGFKNPVPLPVHDLVWIAYVLGVPVLACFQLETKIVTTFFWSSGASRRGCFMGEQEHYKVCFVSIGYVHWLSWFISAGWVGLCPLNELLFVHWMKWFLSTDWVGLRTLNELVYAQRMKWFMFTTWFMYTEWVGLCPFDEKIFNWLIMLTCCVSRMDVISTEWIVCPADELHIFFWMKLMSSGWMSRGWMFGPLDEFNDHWINVLSSEYMFCPLERFVFVIFSTTQLQASVNPHVRSTLTTRHIWCFEASWLRQ